MIKFKKVRFTKTEVPIISKKEKKEIDKSKKVDLSKNKKVKKVKAMNEEQINKAEKIVNNLIDSGHVKVVKKDRGLIERTESSKLVLTEDNRQVLGD